MQPDASSPLRIARPTRSIAAVRAFWIEALGMEVLWSTDAYGGGHALLMVGFPGASWHLELVEDSEAAAGSNPSVEDQLVLYLGESADEALLARLVGAGGVRREGNAYWEQWGITIEDPDGYRLVLSHRTWD